MAIWHGWTARFTRLFRRGATERQLQEEIEFHLAAETGRNLAQGMSPEAARRKALLDFGGIEVTKEAHRDGRGTRWLEEAMGDVRFGLRTLRRNPVATGAAVLSLALGIGANTAIFSAVNRVILQPLPFLQPDRLVMLWEENSEKGWYKETAAPANMFDWREQVAAFEDVAAYTGGGSRTLTGEGDPVLLKTMRVTGNFFSVLGVPAALGRTFTDQETWQSGPSVALLSDATWRSRFGGRPDVIGKTVRLDDHPVQVVGVMPAGFSFPQKGTDFWLATEWDAALRQQDFFRRAHWIRPIARLKPGVSRAVADAQLQAVAQRLQQQHPVLNHLMGAGLTPLHEFEIGNTRKPLLLLLAAVALLLLITCANVGNLLLVQATAREREMSLRLALGAGKGRLIRQALTESLVLSVCGGLTGLVLGLWLTRLLIALQPPGMLPVDGVGVDWAVLFYVVAITAMSGLLFGLAPALWNRRRRPSEALKEGGRSGSGSRRTRRWTDVLVVGEVALALVLTLGAGLLVRSFLRLQQVDPGFDGRGVLSFALSLPEARYNDTTGVTFFQQLDEQVRAVPGIEAVGMTRRLPLTGRGYTSDYSVAGRPADAYGSEVAHNSITPDYFRVMGVPLLRGRFFTDADRAESEPVTIINDQLARQAFPGEDPIGQRMSFDRLPDSTTRWYQVVGVVGGERQTQLASPPQIEAFVPLGQDANTYLTTVVRARGEPNDLVPLVRSVVAQLDPTLVVQEVQTMDEVRHESLARERFLTLVLLVFAATGVLLAVVGVYGVMAQMARSRTRELGIRLALGASPSEVQWLVVRYGVVLAGTGVAIGVPVAAGAGQWIRALLYDVRPTDPATFLVVPAVLALTALTASWLPARRASRTNPAVVLREE